MTTGEQTLEPGQKLEMVTKAAEVTVLTVPEQIFQISEEWLSRKKVELKTAEQALVQLLAREWKTRAYVDARQRERYDKLMEARRNAEARGKVFEQPTSGVGREAWDVFTQAFAKGGTTLSYMYRRGSEWYGANGVDAHYGLFYARGVLAGAYEASA